MFAAKRLLSSFIVDMTLVCSIVCIAFSQPRFSEITKLSRVSEFSFSFLGQNVIWKFFPFCNPFFQQLFILVFGLIASFLLPLIPPLSIQKIYQTGP